MSKKQGTQLRRDPPLDPNDIVAERIYRVEESDPPETVTVRLGRPKKRASDGLFVCGAEIDEGGRIWVRYMEGVDGIEALKLALMVIGTDLRHIYDQLDGKLSWQNGQCKNLDVPTYPDFSLETDVD